MRRSLLSLENWLKGYELSGNIPAYTIQGFRNGRSPVTNATQHIGYKYTLCMDIADFFDSVTKEKVKAVAGYGIAHLNVEMYHEGVARQGFPTSPALANIAAVAFDIAICRFLKKKNLEVKYTRYADDLSFSFNDKAIYEILINKIPNIISKTGFKINPKKTRLQSSAYGKRNITGVMVDDNGISVSRKFKRKLRAAAHQGNDTSLQGMKEWSQLKTPVVNYICDEKEYRRRLAYSLKRLYIRPYVEPQVLLDREFFQRSEGNYLITNNIFYILGMTDLAENWTSCYKRTGCNRRAPSFLSSFDCIRVGVELSDKLVRYRGHVWNKIKSRVLIATTPEGQMYASSRYGASAENDSHFVKWLESQGVAMKSPSDGRVYITDIPMVKPARSALYGALNYDSDKKLLYIGR